MLINVVQSVLQKLTSFSNSLTMRQGKTKNHNRGHGLVLISIDFDNLLHLLLSFHFNWKNISTTRDSVSHGLSKHLKFCQKYSAAQGIFILSWLCVFKQFNNTNKTESGTFQLSSQCLDIPMKHSLSLLFDILVLTRVYFC